MKGKLLSLRRTGSEISAMSDEALLAACGTGDMAALDALFERFNLPLYRFLGRLTHDRAVCDDLVQATFLEVRRVARRFRGASSVKTWILGIGSNVARHQLRGERRRRIRQHDYAERLTVVCSRPDEQVEQQELLERVAAVLATLPHHQQVAFVLCDLEQVPGVDVARALGVPEGTIWRRLHVARRSVRQAFEESGR